MPSDKPPLYLPVGAMNTLTTALYATVSRVFGVSERIVDDQITAACGPGTDFISVHRRPAEMLRYLTEGVLPTQDGSHTPPEWTGMAERGGRLVVLTPTEHSAYMDQALSSALYSATLRYAAAHLGRGASIMNETLRVRYGPRSARQRDVVIDARRMYTLLDCVASARMWAGDPPAYEVGPAALDDLRTRRGALRYRIALASDSFGVPAAVISRRLVTLRGPLADEDFDGLFHRLRALDENYDVVRKELRGT